MKNLLKLFSVLMVMIGSIAFGQTIDPRGILEHQTVQKEGQRYGIICYLETKEFYKDGISESQFVENVLSYQFDNGERPEDFKKFLGSIYKLHTMRADNNTVYDNVDSVAFANFTNSALKYYKAGLSKEENLSTVFTQGSKIKPPKNGWLNMARKLIDLIDDEFGGR